MAQINFSTQWLHIANFFIAYFTHNQTYKFAEVAEK